MPVHSGVAAAHLEQALKSVISQTVAACQVVVVVDGPVTSAHEAVLTTFPGLTLVRLPQNLGAGLALAAGLRSCRGTWVMRADADDINHPDRLRRQLALVTGSGAQVCSAALLEFGSGPDDVLGVRRCPVTHAAVARQMRSRNPVNHPAAMFHREAAVSAGGYQSLPFLEDYDLWARMLRDGSRFVGTDQPLVHYRSPGMLGRRRQRAARQAERALQSRLRSYGLLGPVRAARNRVVRGIYLRLPLPVLRLVYRSVFRRRVADGQRPELADTHRSRVA